MNHDVGGNRNRHAPEILAMKAIVADPEPYVSEWRMAAGAGAGPDDGNASEGPGARAAELPCRQQATASKATSMSFRACILDPCGSVQRIIIM